MTNNRTSEEVARRAYELFVSRGGEHGRDLDDWLEAERQVTGNGGPRGRTLPFVSEPRAAKTAAPKRRR